jgi:hypothetical protein
LYCKRYVNWGYQNLFCRRLFEVVFFRSLDGLNENVGQKVIREIARRHLSSVFKCHTFDSWYHVIVFDDFYRMACDKGPVLNGNLS